MRRTFQVLIILLTIHSLFGFSSYQQASSGTVELLDRSGKPVTGITDGDTVRVKLTVSGATGAREITFKLDDLGLSVGGCSIASGSSCQSDAFSTLGWHWDPGGVARDVRFIKAVDAAGNLVAKSAAIAVAPRPVVLVHGFVSSWETWKPYLGSGGLLESLGIRGFAIGDGQVPGALNTGSITEPTRTTNTLAQNAAVEAQYIAGVKQATGAQMVDIVGHSMGGMISRYYIDRLMSERDVAQLIMLGSPMGGSDCSVLPAALGFYLPASIEIRQSYMQGVFNSQITHRRGVPFFDLAGTAIRQPFQSPCAAVPNDLAVSIESVNAIPLESAQFDALHTDLTGSPAVFQSFVLPLLEKPAGTFTPALDPAMSTDIPAPLPFTRVYTGHVARGGTSDLAITIDPGLSVASFAMYDATQSTSVTVRGASGNVIQLDPQKNGFIQVKDPSTLVYLGYGFSNPKPGIWHVTVLATDATPAAGADFAMSVYFLGGALLDAAASTPIAKVGETVRFTASLTLGGQPLDIVKAQAVIRSPDGKTESVGLEPGTPASASWTPRLEGIHGVDIVVTGHAPDGSPVERTAFLAEEVQPNPSKLQVSANVVIVLLGVLAAVALVLSLVIYLLTRLFRRRASVRK